MSAVYISVGSEAVVGEPVEVVTMEDLPSGPPKEVTVVAIPSSDTELEIKWQVRVELDFRRCNTFAHVVYSFCT